MIVPENTKRPFLPLGSPAVRDRPKEKPRTLPKVVGPGNVRQGERLGPKFAELSAAFEAQRLTVEPSDNKEVDPELVLVFDLAGTIKDLGKAIDKVPGLEFLSEYLDGDIKADDDFYVTRAGARTTDMVSHSLNVVASNAAAANELVSLFHAWQKDKAATFPHGLAPLRTLFDQLLDLRRWGVEDRIRETGLLERWREDLIVVGKSGPPVQVEIELWYRADKEVRGVAEDSIIALISGLGGSVNSRCDIPEIRYHALLASIPRHLVVEAVEQGAGQISLLVAEQMMFVSPHRPMAIDAPDAEVFASPTILPTSVISDDSKPRIALLDGLPLTNHELLAGRLIIDDPDGYGEDYPVESRCHGTAMASLIIHGDISTPGQALTRPLYVRPVLSPDSITGSEIVQRSVLLTDLLHRAIRRMVEGDAPQRPTAESVRIINLSIGEPTRTFIRRISPVGRLLDWLSVKFNLLIIVSAGNHGPLEVSDDFVGDSEAMHSEVMRAYFDSSRTRGLLPPADALNVLTVGATHDDAVSDMTLPDTVVDPNCKGYPALYSATGPGVRRSIKPEILFSGGRQVFTRPVSQQSGESIHLQPARTTATGPGIRVAAPMSGGGVNGQRFLCGTSNAAALITREASGLFDILEAAQPIEGLMAPDASFHPVLVRALLIHAAGWGSLSAKLQAFLDSPPRKKRSDLANILGYGVFDPARAVAASSSRAVLLGWGWIKQDQEAVFNVPVPQSLRAKTDWHQITVTLASQGRTVSGLNKYRVSKTYFDGLSTYLTGGTRRDADYHAVRRGTCQHEVFAGKKTLAPGSEMLPISIQCSKDAQQSSDPVRYGLVVSVETAPQTSVTVYEEIREALVVQARAQARDRVQVNPTNI
jgi:hypothetical protein